MTQKTYTIAKAMREVVLETFGSMDLFVQIMDPEKIEITESDLITWSWVDIHDPLNGTVVILMPNRLQREICLRLIHVGLDEVEAEDLSDAQSEVTNMIAGRLVNLFVHGSVTPSISFPQIGSGAPNVREGTWKLLAFEVESSWMMLFATGDKLLNFDDAAYAPELENPNTTSVFKSAVKRNKTSSYSSHETSVVEARDVSSLDNFSGSYAVIPPGPEPKEGEEEIDSQENIAARNVKSTVRVSREDAGEVTDANNSTDALTESSSESSVVEETPSMAHAVVKDEESGESRTEFMAVPEKLGGFVVKKKLGSGAMADVYLAVQEPLDRQVALKVLSGSLVQDSDFESRFFREARLAAAVSHSNVVSVFDAGKEGDFLFMALEYVAGGDLSEVLERDGRIEEAEAISMFIACLDGLQAIDDAGLVHRDIKPANILLGYDGTPQIGDLGLARPTESVEDSQMTIAGTLMGTPAYMSPEQAMGESDIDIRSDIFGMGSTLFTTLTGEMPFNGRTPADTMMKVVNARVPDPKTYVDILSVGIGKVIQKAMYKDPKMRYQKPRDFADALRGLQGSDDNGGKWLGRLFGRK
ncbi:MAG: protein kinase [Planctomycetes bacterium]|nr:protein kinase [Planctomycetota bacterium]